MFNPDSKFYIIVGRIAELIQVNALFLFCCIPIFTVGASMTAMYTVTRKMVDNEMGYITRTFFKAFKENFKKATIMWMIMLISLIALFFDLKIVNGLVNNELAFVLRVLIFFVFLLWVFIFMYHIPLQSTFENTVKNTIKNSLLISIANLPFTVLALIVFTSPIGAMFLFRNNAMLFSTLMLLIWPVGVSYINSYIIGHVLKKYMPEEKKVTRE